MNKKLLTMGLAALLMAGCSSDDVVVGEGDNGGAVNGTAYVGLKLQLPSVNGSRAGESFEAATADENKVNTLDVVFLDDANKVVQHEVIDIDELHWTDDPAAGIGTVAELPVIKMSKSGAQNVLILVNNQNNVAIPAVGNTINVATATDVSALNTTTGGFFMTNALLTDGTNSSYLVSVTPKETEAEAQAEASKNVIYVERAAAKVTVTANSSYTVSSHAAEDYQGSEVKFSGWLLDVTNTKFYPVHQMDNKYFSVDYISTASSAAFTGENAHKGNRFYETVATPKRVYWATAPYYDEAAVISGTPTFTVATDETPVGNFKAFGSLVPQYCAENTFTVQQMMQTHTTRTLLKATYKPAKVMLKKDGDVDWSLQTPPASGADVVAADITDGMNWYRLGNSSNAWVEKSLNARLLKYFKDEAGMTDATAVTIEKVKAGTHAFSENIGGETYNVVKVVRSGASTEVVGTDLDNLRQAFGKLTAFVDGVCYYQVRIKHFGATPGYTPWGNDSGAPTLAGLADAYTNYLTYGTDDTKKKALDKEYLGRYGVVRNNYYDITINSVSGPGEPTINDIKPTTDPDDQQNYYIQATVKILDWAKRSQSVNL